MSEAEELDSIDREVGRYLLQHKVVDRQRLQEAVDFAAERGIGFRKALLELDMVDLEFLQRFLPKDVGDFSDADLAQAGIEMEGGPAAPPPPEFAPAPDLTKSMLDGTVPGAGELLLNGHDGEPLRLGDYLVRDKVVDPAQLDQALTYAQENDLFLGTALISMRMIGEDLLSRYIIRQRQDQQRFQKKQKKRLRLGDILVEQEVITPDQLQSALQLSMQEGLRVGEVLLEKGFVTEDEVAQALSRQLMIPVIDLKKKPPDPTVAVMLSRKLVVKHQAIPYRREGQLLTVAMVDPLDVIALDDFKSMSRCQVMPVITTKKNFDHAVKTFLGGEEEEMFEWFAGQEDEDAVKDIDLSDQGPIIQLVNRTVSTAQRRGVSDIHIDPRDGEGVVIRFREDGVLRDFYTAPLEMAPQIAARVKVMASLDIAETRLAQDGKFRLKIGGNVVDFRVSIVPIVAGEKIVMRILDQSKARVKLKDLGLTPRAYKWFTDDGIFRPNGIVLVTGPTGSGKTSTLYAGLMAIADPKKNIHTVEDPVEFTLPGVSQVQVHPEWGLDFSATLKSLLRQDPDVILLGEIRDRETAQIALKAAMTGHLVLSTLHTNDAISTIDRFLSMDIDRFLVGTAIKVVLAQRLVKKVCPSCRIVEEDGAEKLKQMGLTDGLLEEAGIASWDEIVVYKAVGCKECDDVGFRGRTGIFEVIRFDEEITEMLMAGESNRAIYDTCRRKGMISLREAALIRAAQGVTSLSEVTRLTVPEPSSQERAHHGTFLDQDGVEEESAMAAAEDVRKLTELVASLATMAATPAPAPAPPTPAAPAEPAGPAANPAAAQKILAVFQDAWGAGDLARPGAKLGLERLQHYLESYDAFLRPVPPSPAPVDLAALAQATVVDSLTRLCRRATLLTETRVDPKSFQTETQFAAVPKVSADAAQLGRALEQLALNSLQAMSGGGRMKLVTRAVTGGVELILADTGPGLTPEVYAEVRAPFVSRQKFGLGLGLPLAERLVQESGGGIEVRGLPGKGTLVTLRFPVDLRAGI